MKNICRLEQTELYKSMIYLKNEILIVKFLNINGDYNENLKSLVEKLILLRLSINEIHRFKHKQQLHL